MKTALVVIAKNEDNYLKEWVDYNLGIGFTDIFICQNNWRYQKNDIQYSNVHFVECDGHRMQNSCYNTCLNKYYQDYDFMAFFDIDEFLYLHYHKNINEYLESFLDKECIYVNWRLFGDNGLEKVYDSYSVADRFTRCCKTQMRLGKYIVNTRVLKNNVVFYNPHILIYKDQQNKFPRYFNTNGEQYNDVPWNVTDISNQQAELYHFRNKTYQECYDRKFGQDDVQHEASECKFLTDKDEFDRQFEEHNKNDIKNTSLLNEITPQWLILIVGTKDIQEDLFKNDPKFNNRNYAIFNVSDKIITSKYVNVINSVDIKDYTRLGYQYAESEVIYNVYKLGLFKEYKYIGLIHYDFELFNKKNATGNITENITRILDAGFDYISFQNMNIGYVLNNANIMLDERDRNCVFPQFSIVENPITCEGYILKHINSVFKKNIEVKDIDMSKNMNMCCSFIMSRNIFQDLGRLFVDIIDEHYMDRFDDKKINRIPGNVMERVLGLFSTMYRHYEFDLIHRHITSDEFIKDGTLMQKVRY